MPDTIFYERFEMDLKETQGLLDVLENKTGHTGKFDTWNCNCHSYVKRALKQMHPNNPSYYTLRSKLYSRDN